MKRTVKKTVGISSEEQDEDREMISNELLGRAQEFINTVNPMSEDTLLSIGVDSLMLAKEWPTQEEISELSEDQWEDMHFWFASIIPTLVCEVKRYRTPYLSNTIH